MDYIRQELLRQQAALARLLLGGAAEETVSRTGWAEKTGGETRLFSGGYSAADTWSGAPQAAEATDGQASVQGHMADGEAAGAEFEWAGGEPPMDGLPAGATEALAENRRRAAGGKGLLAAGGNRWPLAGSGGTAWTETGERSGAEALSRLIQRDARRYDGGFSLY